MRAKRIAQFFGHMFEAIGGCLLRERKIKAQDEAQKGLQDTYDLIMKYNRMRAERYASNNYSVNLEGKPDV